MPPSSRPKALVGTTVHHADDVRIAKKLIPALVREFDVTYVSRPPGPSSPTGAAWEAVGGGRVGRWFALARRVRRSDWDVLVLHDPETMPIGWLNRRRGAVVFDLHERLPDQVRHKSWIPSLLRGPASLLARWALGVTDRLLTVTLAEAGYADLVSQSAPVFANHPRALEPAESPPNGRAVYVGDVTVERGLEDLVRAVVAAGVGLDVVGPCPFDFERRLGDLAAGSDVVLHGRLPHDDAMRVVRASSVAVSPLRDLPNYRWSLPTKVEEYLAIGVPVVASDLPATAEVADGRAVRLYPPGDVDALAAALGAVVDDGDLLALARAQAAAGVIPTWDDAAVLDWYRSLIA